jgi:hypothetical protein
MPVELTLIVMNRKDVRIQRGHKDITGELFEGDDLASETIGLFQRWLREGRLQSRDEFTLLGKYLERVLFTDQGIAGEFQKALSEAKERRERLILRLRFDDRAEDMADWPWEYLYRPDRPGRKGFFFSTDVNLSLSRRLSGQDDETKGDDEPPLEVGIAVANVPDLGPVSGHKIADALKDLDKKSEVKINHQLWEGVTAGGLIQALADLKRLHVLHFIGHGRYRDRQGRIALAPIDSDGEPDWKESDEFAALLTRNPIRPLVVVLHLSPPAGTDRDANLMANFTAVAPALLRAGIRSVVAMRYPIPDDAAQRFSEVFYRELLHGSPVDVAVQEARSLLQVLSSQSDRRGFGTPVLFMQTRAGITLPSGDDVQAGPATAPSAGMPVMGGRPASTSPASEPRPALPPRWPADSPP